MVHFVFLRFNIGRIIKNKLGEGAIHSSLQYNGSRINHTAFPFMSASFLILLCVWYTNNNSCTDTDEAAPIRVNSRPFLSCWCSRWWCNVVIPLFVKGLMSNVVYSDITGSYAYMMRTTWHLHFFFFRTLLLSSFWTRRGHRCRPFSPPVLAFNFYRA